MKSNILLFRTERSETSLVLGYLSYAILGVICLSLPLCRKTSISFLDNLFTAISAISTTGLTTVSVADSYSILGQIVVLLLIQLGGIGYMTFGSFLILSTRQTISEHRQSIHKTSFSLPKDFSILKFIKSVVLYTGVIELIGAVMLYSAFASDNRANPVWSAVFHSISSFCTAGFSLYNNSFELYADNIYLNSVVAILSFLGAIGYIVMVDLWLVIKGKKKNITFTSQIILVFTIALLILGTVILFVEDSIKNGIHANSFLYSFFQSMTALTTVGFNTIPIGKMSSFALFTLMILMIIGASPSGTGGGIKSTTVSSIIGVITSVFSYKKEYVNYHIPQKIEIEQKRKSFISRLMGNKKDNVLEEEFSTLEKEEEINTELDKTFGDVFRIKIMDRIIPFDRVIHAVATFTFYFVILFIGVLFLLATEPFSFEQIFFEAASGLGTVGLSTGITGSLTNCGKFIVIILMFIGRLGPITFGSFLFSRKPKRKLENDFEDIVI